MNNKCHYFLRLDLPPDDPMAVIESGPLLPVEKTEDVWLTSVTTGRPLWRVRRRDVRAISRQEALTLAREMVDLARMPVAPATRGPRR